VNRQQKARDTLLRWQSRKRTRAAVARAKALGDGQREFWLILDAQVWQHILVMRACRRSVMAALGTDWQEWEARER
jgi:hypothetical protein